MSKNIFRDLTANDIDVRVAMVKPNGVSLLLYKDARVDMDILDETLGVENWQREHYECKGNLFCRVGIRCGDNGWIWKADCGSESNTEAQKGEASDSFKRACFNWGIGRELYTAPFIWVNSDKCTINNGKCADKFSVKDITIENKQITKLVIVNDTTKAVCFTYGDKKVGDSKKADLKPIYKCSDCGKQLEDTPKKDGTTYAASTLASDTQKTFGRVLCLECARKQRKLEEAQKIIENEMPS